MIRKKKKNFLKLPYYHLMSVQICHITDVRIWEKEYFSHVPAKPITVIHHHLKRNLLTILICTSPCISKFPVPPSPKRYGKITKNFENAAKSSRPSFYIRQPKVKSVSSFISRYPKNSFYTSKEVTAY